MRPVWALLEARLTLAPNAVDDADVRDRTTDYLDQLAQSEVRQACVWRAHCRQLTIEHERRPTASPEEARLTMAIRRGATRSCGRRRSTNLTRTSASRDCLRVSAVPQSVCDIAGYEDMLTNSNLPADLQTANPSLYQSSLSALDASQQGVLADIASKAAEGGDAVVAAKAYAELQAEEGSAA